MLRCDCHPVITNKHQYKVARRALLSLRARVGHASDPVDDMGDGRSEMEERILQLTRDVQLYENLQVGDAPLLSVGNLDALSDLLIAARIARGMTQKDLANFLGLKMQQIQKYEADGYQTASLRRIATIAEALGLDVHQTGELVGQRALGVADPSRPSAFPLGEMYRRGWLAPYGGLSLDTREAATRHLSAFFAQAFGELSGPRRRYARSSGPPHAPAISAWEARIMILADACPPARIPMPTLVNENWLSTLVGLTRLRDGVRQARDYLEEIGVALIVEEALPGMRLDGAALRSSKGRLVVGLTLRDPRLETFWFTLMHLLAHLVLHVAPKGYDAIFDELDAPANSDIEDEADVFSRELLIPSRKWSQCKSQFSWSRKTVIEDARRLGVGPAVVEGHIRRQYGEAQVRTRLTPNVDVRKLLKI